MSRLLWAIVFSLAWCCAVVHAQHPEAASAAGPLTVGVKVAPPFVIKEEDGTFGGISIALWEQAAERLELEFEYHETDLSGLIDGLQNGMLDVSVAALTITVSREEVIDFTHPFHTTGLAIAVPEQGGAVWSVVKALFSVEFLATLAALTGLLMLVGLLLWLAERKNNKAMFGGSVPKGIGSSFWWAAVTMTTVGYGDKAPITLWGRIIALVWMFAGIIIISSFTAAIATSLTVGQLESSISGIDDLSGVRVATVEGSVSEEFLRERGVRFASTQTIDDAVRGLAQEEYDAVLYDKPILQYVAAQEYPKRTRVLPRTFARQDYALALPNTSALREPLNQALLVVISDNDWQEVLARHLGADQ